MKDIIIIGAGPAGVSAALYAKARGKDILVFEKNKVGGIIGNVSKVSHYASVGENLTGPEFAKELEDQLNYSNIEVKYEEVKSVSKVDDGFKVTTNNGEYFSKKLIAACGSTLKELPLDKAFQFKHWPLKANHDYKNKTVIVNGGSDGACKEALFIAKDAKSVHIVQDQDKILCIDEFKKQIDAAKNIVIHTGTTLEDIEITNGICTRAITTTGTIEDENGIEIYVQIGQTGNSEMFKDIAEINNSFIAEDVKTNIDGLFFAGDIRVKDVKQVATAVADGALAGIMASK